MLETVLAYLAHGWSVFPVDGKKPAVQWGKFRETPATAEQVSAWYSGHDEYGVAVALGSASGIVRVDAEGPVPWDQFPLPNTLQFRTPNGRGWIYKHHPGIVTEVLWKGEGEHQELRVQSDGAYTVLPPSPHPSGGFYSWDNDEAIADPPDWVRDRAVARVLADLEQQLRPTVKQPDAGELRIALSFLRTYDDYDEWVKVGMSCAYADRAAGGDTYFKLWEEWSRQSSKFHEGECAKKYEGFKRSSGRVRTLASVMSAAEKESDGKFKWTSRHEPINDMGFAAVLATMHSKDIKHCADVGWMAWDGRCWVKGTNGEKRVQEKQKDVVNYRRNAALRSALKYHAEHRDDPEFDRVMRRKNNAYRCITSHGNGQHIRDARALAESAPEIAADHHDFDTHLFLFNCKNGTVDLRTGELREHRQSDMLTCMCPHAYNAEAQCTRWLKLLDGVFCGRESIIRYVHKLLGLCLTGDVTEHVLVNFLGDGSNGKGAIMRIVSHILGDDYCGVAPMSLLLQQRQRGHPTEFMTLLGKRLVWASELEDGMRWDETVVKQLTGGDRVKGRFCGQDFVTLDPTWKIVIATNSMPRVLGTDDGIRRRIKVVPFNVRFWKPSDEGYQEGFPLRDPKLEEAIVREEAEGVLAWMMKGCLLWQKETLGEPSDVQIATQSYFQENDQLLAFITDRCDIGPDCRERGEKFREAFKATGAKFTAKHLTSRLAKLNILQDDTGKYYIGIRLK